MMTKHQQNYLISFLELHGYFHVRKSLGNECMAMRILLIGNLLVTICYVNVDALSADILIPTEDCGRFADQMKLQS